MLADARKGVTVMRRRSMSRIGGSGSVRRMENSSGAASVTASETGGLEDLAKHRGSVLGDLPGAAQPSQKMFESLVWCALRQFDTALPVFVEAESRKIGLLRVPERLLERMRASACVRIHAPAAERVRFLLAEYRHLLEEPAWLKTLLLRLSALHSKETVGRWIAQIDAREWPALVADLLATHYDPAYLRSMEKNYPGLVDAALLDVPRLDDTGFDSGASALLGH